MASNHPSHIPEISVIILNWNGKYYLEKCLESVLKTSYPFFEIIVSDNGSTDGSVKMVQENYPEVILIENEANLGFSEGNNVAIKRARGEIIILLNNDAWVDRNWIREIVKVAKDPMIGIVGCKVYYGNTEIIQSVGFQIHPSGRPISIGQLQIDQLQFDKVMDVDYVMGAALAIKRSVINMIGLLDPVFYSYYEDLEWCYRAKKIGYRVVVAPRAIVHHLTSKSWVKRPFRQAYLNEKNRLFFIKKHFGGLELLKSLTLYELEFTIRKINELLTGRLVIQKVGLNEALHSKNLGLLASVFYHLGAKILAYPSILLHSVKLTFSQIRNN